MEVLSQGLGAADAGRRLLLLQRAVVVGLAAQLERFGTRCVDGGDKVPCVLGHHLDDGYGGAEVGVDVVSYLAGKFEELAAFLARSETIC